MVFGNIDRIWSAFLKTRVPFFLNVFPSLALSFALAPSAGLLGVPSAWADGCVSTGSLTRIMENCTPSPAPPGKGGARKRIPTLFRKGWTLKIRVSQGDRYSTIRSSVASWVAKRLYPHATVEEGVLLNSAIQNLARTGFPVDASKESDLVAKVKVTAETLNRIASRLEKAVQSGHGSYRVDRIVVTGGSEKENRFASANMPSPKDGILDLDQVSESLYALSQVQGFSRADGLFAPVIATRNVTFSLSHVLTIHSDKKDRVGDIRRQVFLLMARLVVDMKTPRSRKIVETLADRLSSTSWPLMTIQSLPNDNYRVEVPPALLNTLKNILLQAAAFGTADAGSYVVDRTGALSTGNLFAPAPTVPEFDNLFVGLAPTPTFAGSQIEVDNYGYAPTGAVVLNASGNVNNVGFAGGLFTVTASTSFGGLNAGGLGYSLPIGLYVRTGVDFNAMNYSLGLGFSPWGHGTNTAALTALGVSGSNYSGDLWLSEVLIEKEGRRLALKETGFLKEFQDTYSQTVQNDRSIAGGILDLSGSRTQGQFSASFDLSDTEYMLSQGSSSSPANPFYADTPGLQNYLSGSGQIGFAFTPVYSIVLGTVDQQYFGGGVLDPMLQATLGGMSNVMALPTASLFGNDLYAASLTATRTDAVRSGTFSSSAFFDWGQVDGVGQFSAMGPGVEEAYSARHFFARIDVAVPVGALPTQGLGVFIPALAGGHLGQGGIPLQLWLSIGIRD